MVGCVTLDIICLVMRAKWSMQWWLMKIAGKIVCRKPASTACLLLTLLPVNHVNCMTRRLWWYTWIGQILLNLHTTSTVLMVSYKSWLYCFFLFYLRSEIHIASLYSILCISWDRLFYGGSACSNVTWNDVWLHLTNVFLWSFRYSLVHMAG